MKKWTLYLLISILALGTTSAQTFSAFVNKKEVTVNETFQVSFQLKNAQARAKFPSFQGLKNLGGPNTSQSTSIVNGQVSQSVTYSFYLQAPKEGTFTIGSASVQVGGKTLKTDPIKIKSVKGTAKPAAAGQQGNQGGQAQTQPVSKDLMKQISERAFIRVYASKTNCYLGEQITLTFKFFNAGLKLFDIEFEEVPKINGFWVENVDLGNQQFKPEVLDGVRYNSVLLKKYVLFPQKVGNLTIDPFKINMMVRVTSQSRKPRNIFDSFFGQYKDVPFTTTSRKTTIKVKQLPTSGRPANFDGAVGKYKLDVNLDKEAAQTGDAVTLKAKIEGQGNIRLINPLRLDFPPDFEVYDPKVKERISTSSGRASGSKSFDYLIVPQIAGEYKLPVISFSYFDPEVKTYKTLSSDTYTLKVEGEPLKEASTLTNLRKEDIELIGEDIRYIKTGDVRLSEKGKSFYGSTGFWLLSLSPFLVFFGLVTFKRRRDAMLGDVVGTRMKRATKVARKRLETARKLMDAGDNKGFHKEASNAIWGYLSDKLAIGQSELARDNIRALLDERSAREETVDHLIQYLDNCEMALFAPEGAASGLKSDYEEALGLIVSLEEQLK